MEGRMKGVFTKGFSMPMDDKMEGSYMEMAGAAQSSSNDSEILPQGSRRRWFSRRRNSEDTIASSTSTIRKQGQSSASNAQRNCRGPKKRDKVYAKVRGRSVRDG